MREEERGEERRERRREERFGELIGMPHALDLQQKYVCNATNVIAGAPRKGITRRTTRRTLEAKIVYTTLREGRDGPREPVGDARPLARSEIAFARLRRRAT